MPCTTCVNVYQSVMCCEFSELLTTPCHSLTYPHLQIATRPIAHSADAAAATITRAITASVHVCRLIMKSRGIIPAYNSPPVSGYRFGPFVVDRTRYRALRGDQVLELTPKLLDLLLHLVEHAGALVTKEQLLGALWPGANVTDNALAQAVSELRQALGDAAATPQFIKTVARRGYRFIAPVDRIESAAIDVAIDERRADAPRNHPGEANH